MGKQERYSNLYASPIPPSIFFFFVLSVAEKKKIQMPPNSVMYRKEKIEKNSRIDIAQKKKQFHILSTQPAEIRKKRTSLHMRA